MLPEPQFSLSIKIILFISKILEAGIGGRHALPVAQAARILELDFPLNYI